MRAVCSGGTAEIERGRRQAGTDAAACLARQMLRPVEFAAAATAMRQVIMLRRGMRGR